MNASSIIALFGATATGKTALSVALAKALDGEIVNMDSMQIYREISIGSAKPSKQEMAGVPHHLFSIVSVNEPFTVADYRALALQAIDDIRRRGKQVILVGGTGLYLSSLYYDYAFREPGADPERTATAQELAQLTELIDVHNPRRLQRALHSGKVHLAEERVVSNLPITIFWLDMPRNVLHARIEKRVEQMVAQGLIEEARALFSGGLAPEISSARKGIGYKELYAAFCGKIGMKEAIEQIKIHTRQYAKRQITWIRNQYPAVHHLDASLPISELIDEIRLNLGGDSEKHS